MANNRASQREGPLGVVVGFQERDLTAPGVEMPRIHSLCAIVIAVTACGTQKMPSARRARAPVPAVESSAAAQPAPRSDALYVYLPVGKRDPFVATQRHEDREETPLQKWSIEQFILKTTVTGTASPKAVIQDPDSRAWLISIGDYVGNKWGKVTSIEADQIVVTENIGDAVGRLHRQPLKLVLPSQGSVDGRDHMIDVPPRK
jgi:Tfp pilus assembly protein PilP